ncbi:MAG: tetratricopeptide repeat protein [Candidatus Cloacimonas sp.]|jgi:Flp pilus assembly protein TadD|nr:tetratricopeptide repeat protein [Candidatus Cloacimonas sp.]
MVNYYDLLGVSEKATEDEIRVSIKERKRIWTQRQNAPKIEQQQEATNNIRMIPDIEANLLNPQKRAAYDKQLISAPKADYKFDDKQTDVSELIQECWRLLSVGNVPDAMMSATRAVELQGNNPDAVALLGYCKAQWGEIQDAVHDYKKAISLRPNDPSFYFDLGGIYEQNEQWKDAMQQYQRACQIDPKEPVYRAAMGSVYIKNEMYREGIELLERCITEAPNNEGFKYLLATAYSESTYQNWTFVESMGQYLTTKIEHVNEAEHYIQKARALNVKDSYLDGRIASIQGAIDDSLKRRFHGNKIAVGAAIAFGIYGLSSDNVGLGIYFIVFGILYAISCMTMQYKLNKRVIEKGGETSTGMLFSGFDEGLGAGCFGMILGLVAVLIIIPIMTLWNFVKNYAMK